MFIKVFFPALALTEPDFLALRTSLHCVFTCRTLAHILQWHLDAGFPMLWPVIILTLFTAVDGFMTFAAHSGVGSYQLITREALIGDTRWGWSSCASSVRLCVDSGWCWRSRCFNLLHKVDMKHILWNATGHVIEKTFMQFTWQRSLCFGQSS